MRQSVPDLIKFFNASKQTSDISAAKKASSPQEVSSNSITNTSSSSSATSTNSDSELETITPSPSPPSLSLELHSEENIVGANTDSNNSTTPADPPSKLELKINESRQSEETVRIFHHSFNSSDELLFPRNYNSLPSKRVKCKPAVLFNLIAKAVLNWVDIEDKREQANTDFIHAKKLTAIHSEYYNFIDAIQKNLAKNDATHTRKALLTIADICFTLYKKELVVNEISISLLNMASRCMGNAIRITVDKKLLKSIQNGYCMLVAHLESAQQIFKEITLLSPLLTRRNETFDNTILAIIYSIYNQTSHSALLFDQATKSQNNDTIRFITHVKTQCRQGKHSLALLNIAKYYLYSLNFLLETRESNQIIAHKCLELAIKINPSCVDADKLIRQLRDEQNLEERATAAVARLPSLLVLG